ncbi:amidoligase family protein [Marivita sp. S0852]|uniref:amidoligase family protein n=1 Tax=Marivita sp. S0852 TaxID=3373893 RepID=UPI003982847B
MHAASGFAPLPYPDTQNGVPRKTGVEIELAGLDIEDICAIVKDTLGGEFEGTDPFLRKVVGTQIGDVTVELDTPARQDSDNEIVRRGLDAATGIVPLEIITDPLDMEGLERFNAFLPKLRKAGATGSRAGVLLGFGVHLNPEVVDPDDPHSLATIRAFGLLEDHLRHVEHLDLTRRALPFVAPWPAEFVTEMLEDKITGIEDVLKVTAKHIHSRNHGLDLLPLLKFACPETFAASFSKTKTAARPTFHFRMPDCRIDEPSWDLRQPWALWHLVEMVAANSALMRKLTQAWATRKTGFLRMNDWAETSAEILSEYNLGDLK